MINNARNSIKQITIVYIENGREMEQDLEIALNTTIGELKRKIEKMFSLSSGALNKKNLRLKQNRDRTTATLENNNKTLYDYRVQTGAKIIFTILENVGGKTNLFDI